MGRDELKPGKDKGKDIVVPAIKSLVPCRFSDLQLLSFHREVSSSIPDLCKRDMWGIEWQWNSPPSPPSYSVYSFLLAF